MNSTAIFKIEFYKQCLMIHVVELTFSILARHQGNTPRANMRPLLVAMFSEGFSNNNNMFSIHSVNCLVEARLESKQQDTQA